jgi:hypothetical protein
MKRAVATLFVATVFACGGAIEGQNKKEIPSCSDVSTCSSGDTCKMSIRGCPNQAPIVVTCSCSGGSFACPDIGAPLCDDPPVEPCGFAGRVTPGDSCPLNTKGYRCESNVQIACFPPAPPIECTCDGSQWVCDLPPKCGPPAADAGSTD